MATPRRRLEDPPYDEEEDADRVILERDLLERMTHDQTGRYINGVISLCIVAAIAVIGITIVRPPGADNAALIATVLGLITPVIGILGTLLGRSFFKTFNGQMAASIADRIQAHRALGRLQGRRDPRTPRPGQHPSEAETRSGAEATQSGPGQHPSDS